VFHQDFTDAAVTDPARLALADKVRCVPDEECTRAFPRQFPAVLTARLDDGTTVSERVRHNRGGPENPLTEQELTTKFTLNAERALSPEQATQLVGLVRELRTGRGVGALTGALQIVPSRP
jgi:2-methylcitrate dehydratase PrpD